jgi:hypothetical protein
MNPIHQKIVEDCRIPRLYEKSAEEVVDSMLVMKGKGIDGKDEIVFATAWCLCLSMVGISRYYGKMIMCRMVVCGLMDKEFLTKELTVVTEIPEWERCLINWWFARA